MATSIILTLTQRPPTTKILLVGSLADFDSLIQWLKLVLLVLYFGRRSSVHSITYQSLTVIQ